MPLAILLDECTDADILRGLRRWLASSGNRGIDALQVGENGAPPKGTSDPDLLQWCEVNDHILVSNDLSTMPGHFHDHMAAGRHSPGVLLIRFGISIGRVVADLEFLAAAGEPDDFRDLIQYIPLR